MMSKYEVLGARILIQSWSRQARVRPSNILGRRRHKVLTKVRAAIASELYCAEFSYPDVGVLMRRDHSTIQTLVKGRKRSR